MNPSNNPRTVSDAWPSRWLHADDLRNRPWVLTIHSITWEELRQARGATEWKPVAHFHEAKKALVLNKTQARAIADVTGSEVFDDWPGHAVQLRPGRAPNGKATIVIGHPPVTEQRMDGDEDATA